MASISNCVVVLGVLLCLMVGTSSAQLTEGFYDNDCSNLNSIIRQVLEEAIEKEPRTAAFLLRLFFHDCFVNGCDASILLDDDPKTNFTGEKNAIPNRNSAMGFDVIDSIKDEVEKQCPGVVSCADILALAAEISVELTQGPYWGVKLGRRDCLTTNQSAANNGIPPPTSNLSNLITFFNNVGLDLIDLVALSGAHTLGKARCTSYRPHICNDSNINTAYAQDLQGNCSCNANTYDPNTQGNYTSDLDYQTPTKFDLNYHIDLTQKKVLLHSDQELYNGGTTDVIVQAYLDHSRNFFNDFTNAMIKMGNITPLTGNEGQIRANCRIVNQNSPPPPQF